MDEAIINQPILGTTRYRIVRRVMGLRSSGQTAVFEAIDRETGQIVALKQWFFRRAEDAERATAFVQQSRQLLGEFGDHLVRIRDVLDLPQHPTWVMDWVEGRSLAACLARSDRIGAGEVLRIGREIAHGLAQLHAAGQCHGDLRPEHCWLCDAGTPFARSGSVRLLDYGMGAFAPRDSTADSAPAPRHFYRAAECWSPASPNDWEAHSIDCTGRTASGHGSPQADWFALGVILYRAFTGRFPFEGRTLAALEAAIRRGQPIPIRRFRRDLPHSVCQRVQSLLSVDPDRRGKSSMQLAADLEREAARLLSGESDRYRWRTVLFPIGVMAILLGGLAGWQSRKLPSAVSQDGAGAAIATHSESVAPEIQHVNAAPQFWNGRHSRVALHLTADDLEHWAMECDASEFRVVAITGWSWDGEERFSAAAVANPQRVSWLIRHRDNADLQTVSGLRTQGYQPLAIRSYRRENQIWRAAIWTNALPRVPVFYCSGEAVLRRTWADLRKRGLTPIHLGASDLGRAAVQFDLTATAAAGIEDWHVECGLTNMQAQEWHRQHLPPRADGWRLQSMAAYRSTDATADAEPRYALLAHREIGGASASAAVWGFSPAEFFAECQQQDSAGWQLAGLTCHAEAAGLRFSAIWHRD
ncbi:serine/threonine protein kinase [Tuwongella immobilis]|uniref:Protein kinase domain-containing protein n=1 Tax=Tuwongella immobilis TaxID=692036 RepID=A0A6C2YKV6_9BACT|nr:serine/threonine-protein kinase [Tuwongella immobilis]VIP01743.1 serine threonine protein kinase with pasta sensor : Uncultured bacterium genome assembly Metasoil_fosmids_resub OS=uncultured bacterium PE=4 SV=1: Pkinase [Tuwongella immobilis]VTR99317.1 serine threonine protein kinase with pasta sensor : Uncultured bacterium genome assembly Metasoil_fosmids_resub OS=uncultured bacterium PE=4 SV=1: Pkinase [Tuwongella immobilis]